MSLTWRKLGEKGKRFPPWFSELRGESGVYAIRIVGLLWSTVVYVGESHTGNLDKTLSRHFQAWSRQKRFWRGQYAPEQTDPGHTYNRADCEVAYQLASRSEAVELQTAWIRKLKPRDNVALVDDDVPF